MAKTAQNEGKLFSDKGHDGVRVVLTGQVGVEKKPFLEGFAQIAAERGKDVTLAHVGDRMYAEAPDVVPGRILDLPKSRLDSLRKSVFKDILALADRVENLVVNTHATFRWRHGLFHAYDHHHMKALNADLYITLVDNVDAIHERLIREHDIEHTLKDILVWREEEIVVTEAMSESVRGYGHAYILARGEQRREDEIRPRRGSKLAASAAAGADQVVIMLVGGSLYVDS